MAPAEPPTGVVVDPGLMDGAPGPTNGYPPWARGPVDAAAGQRARCCLPSRRARGGWPGSRTCPALLAVGDRGNGPTGKLPWPDCLWAYWVEAPAGVFVDDQQAGLSRKSMPGFPAARGDRAVRIHVRVVGKESGASGPHGGALPRVPVARLTRARCAPAHPGRLGWSTVNTLRAQALCWSQAAQGDGVKPSSTVAPPASGPERGIMHCSRKAPAPMRDGKGRGNARPIADGRGLDPVRWMPTL